MKPNNRTLEYKDTAGEWQLTHKAANGNTTLATTEGYANRIDMRESLINACIEVIDFYRTELSEEQHRELSLILKSQG